MTEFVCITVNTAEVSKAVVCVQQKELSSKNCFYALTFIHFILF